MNINQKIFVGVFSVFVWIVALIAHHLWSDIDITAMVTLCQTVLVGLGATHLSSTNIPPDTLVLTASQPKGDSQ